MCHAISAAPPPCRSHPKRSSGGGGGIRTHGSLRFTRFPSAPIRPLSHPSESSSRCGAAHERRQAIWVPQLVSEVPTLRRVRWRSGPVQRMPENQVRSGRKQPSSVADVCRRSPDRHFSRRRCEQRLPKVGSAFAEFRYSPFRGEFDKF